jgi:replication factor C small subunit
MELIQKIFTEKYRPKDFDELIFNDKDTIINNLQNPHLIPSFIFYSNHPGTGKTTTAKIIIKTLDCDALIINSSDERGIDTIREKINIFARSLSSLNNMKRCIFLDEADSLTKVAQDSLRNLMETYSDNCFFIFSCNDVNKIIDPIKSRCVLINFEKPNKSDVLTRLNYICEQEEIDTRDLVTLVDHYYPDIRSMVKAIQNAKINNSSIVIGQIDYDEYLNAIRNSDVEYLYNQTYSGDFDIYGFNKWFFTYLFNNQSKFTIDQLRECALRLADTEKAWNIGATAEVVFLANILQIVKVLK